MNRRYNAISKTSAMRLPVLTLLLIAILQGCQKSSTPSNDNPSTNNVLFARNNDANGNSNDIYSISESGTSETRLTTVGQTNNKSVGNPCWGPNGEIYFSSNYQGEAERQIYVMNGNGSGISRITNNVNFWYGNLNISAAAARIAYVTGNDVTQPRIANCKLDGTDEKTVTSAKHSIHPSFHPDGLRIIYASPESSDPGINSSAPNNIYIANLDGTNKLKITNTSNRVYEHPFLSPDGTKLCYNISGNIYVANADGSGEIKITNNGTVTFGADVHGWSSDGLWLLVNEDVSRTLWLIKRDGSQLKKITSNPNFNPTIK